MNEATPIGGGGTLARPYPPLLTKNHMAELLERTIRTIYRLESQGRIPSSVNVGNQRVWMRDEIMHWVDSSCPPRRAWEKIHPKYRKKPGGC
jgi:predicted DNA-binding transcriptional regulator AlpA